MAFDIIVYKQEELEIALNSGYSSIALCDNTFILPPRGGISYTAIGSVTASVNVNKENYDKLGITCKGFIPDFLGENTNLSGENQQASPGSISSYMLSSYFLSSFVTSYLYRYKGSFITSYKYEYEYEYANSFLSSYITSFAASYTASFTSSYSASFFLDIPYFTENCETERFEECILVNGYGINLI